MAELIVKAIIASRNGKVCKIDDDKPNPSNWILTPRASEKPKSLNDVDPKLIETYKKLGIPLQEQKRLSGVAVDAVFDSVSVATTYKKELTGMSMMYNEEQFGQEDGASAKKGTVESSGTPILDAFSLDVTEEAKKGNLDKVIGREKEVDRIAQILSRRKKNNPVLIGDPGVGKSSIVDGLATKIITKKSDCLS